MKKTLIVSTLIILAVNSFAQQSEIIYEGKPSQNILTVGTGQNSGTYDFDDNGDRDFWLGILNYKWYHVEGYTRREWQFYNKDLWHQFVNEGDTLSILQESYWLNAPEKMVGSKDRLSRIYIWEGVSVDSVIVAVRKPVQEGYCYGWFRFSVVGDGPSSTLPNNTTCIIHDYAYCTIPNYPLLAGQTSLEYGFEEIQSAECISVHPNPSKGMLTVVGKDLKQVVVVNMLGQRVASHQAEGTATTIDISSLPTGIYLATITDENGRRCVRKVVKE